MKISYIHQQGPALKTGLEFYNIRFYNQIYGYTIIFFLPGMLSLVCLAWFKSPWIGGFSILCISLFMICMVLELWNKKAYMKYLAINLNTLDHQEIHFRFEKENFHYLDHLTEIKYKWAYFNGFFVYKGSIFILPKQAMAIMYIIPGANLKDHEFENCVLELSAYLPKMTLKEVQKKY